MDLSEGTGLTGAVTSPHHFKTVSLSAHFTGTPGALSEDKPVNARHIVVLGKDGGFKTYGYPDPHLSPSETPPPLVIVQRPGP